MGSHLKQNEGATADEEVSLPFHPVTLYHGKCSPYPFSMDLFDLFRKKDLAKKILLDGPFPLIDLTVIPDEILLEHGYVAAMEVLQKHIYWRICCRSLKMSERGVLKEEKLDSEYVLKLWPMR